MARFTTSGKRAHMLMVAIVLAAVMSLLMAMAIAPLRTQSQRQKEAELIYRGEHLADGIRRFYFAQRRFPFDLEELIDTEPRLIRQLYPDPMTADGEWELIPLTPQDVSTVKVLRRLLDPAIDATADSSDAAPGQVDSVFAVKNTQITGVRSKSDATGLRVYQESQIYSDWEFTALPREDSILENLLSAPAPAQPKIE